MIIGSHNSWSYLKPKRWWLRPFAFTAKCQNISIKDQYFFHNVRCFDLRLNFDKHGKMYLCHGPTRYKYSEEDLYKDLSYLNNKVELCYIRVVYDARNRWSYSKHNADLFREKCKELEEKFPNLMFWCGRNLYNWEVEYEFWFEPTCEEKYSSVCPPKYLDDWFPWLYAKINNKKIMKMKHDSEILLIDFINIGE